MKDPNRNLLYAVIGICLITLICFGNLLPNAEEPQSKAYIAEFGDRSNIYDGDTWQNVQIQIKTLENEYPLQTLWPSVFIREKTLYVMTDIRIAGIDTAERRPKKAGRTKQSLQRERNAAAAAKAAAEQLLKDNDYQFVIINPTTGKYAGRTVATVLIGKERINLADFLIEKGLGYKYNGGTKRHFEDWWKGQ